MSPNCRCWAEPINATSPIEIEPFIDRRNTKTWPKVPINSTLTEGSASKTAPRNRGEKSLYDQYGGEW